jgi:hypothetical protein
MGNQLVNSMVRGFGMTLGRKAADSVTKGSNKKPVKLSKKNEKLMKINQDAIIGYRSHLENAISLLEDNKITQLEYLDLEQKCLDGIEKCELDIEKIYQSPKRNYWNLVVLLVVVIVLVNLFK